MTTTAVAPAWGTQALADLKRTKGRAELVAGKVIRLMPTGLLPTRVAKRILFLLDPYATRTGCGEVFPDSLGYAIDPPLPGGRQSFAPDVSLYRGPFPANVMEFIDGPPTFAVEVRSENDYGPAADRDIAAKRADYFAAGTVAVWDVDPLAESITLYRRSAPVVPVVFGRGDVAEAEPAVPGWRVDVDEIFG